jgi:hypothetical protein
LRRKLCRFAGFDADNLFPNDKPAKHTRETCNGKWTANAGQDHDGRKPAF